MRPCLTQAGHSRKTAERQRGAANDQVHSVRPDSARRLFLRATLPLAPEHLRLRSGVAHVEVALPAKHATRRVIHVLDWHFVSRESFEADTPGADYQEHLAEVRSVQANQRMLLESLDVQAVYIESLTQENKEQFKRQLGMMRSATCRRHAYW